MNDIVDRGDVIEDEETEETAAETTEEESTEEAGAEESGSEESTTGEESVDESTEGEAAIEDEEEESSEPMLPKHRYDTVQARNRALQEKIARMEQEREQLLEQRKEKPEPDKEENTLEAQLVELDDKINDALLDGDKELASKYRREQRKLEHQVFQEELQSTTQSATQLAREQVRLDSTVDFLEATYPVVNPDSKEFNQEVIDELEGLRLAFESTGQYTASQALLKAAKYMFPDMPEAAEAPQTKPKGDAVKKAVAAAKKQPPDLKDAGQDADTGGIKDDIDPMKLTDKDLEALPEATLAKLRGDIL